MKISREEYRRLILKEKELSVLKEAIVEGAEYNHLTDDLTLLGSEVLEAFKVLYRDRYEEDLEWKKAVYEKDLEEMLKRAEERKNEEKEEEQSSNNT